MLKKSFCLKIPLTIINKGQLARARIESILVESTQSAFFSSRDSSFSYLILLIYVLYFFRYSNYSKMSEGVANKNSLRVTHMKERLLEYKGICLIIIYG